MTDDEEYNLGNNNNAIAQPKKPNAILNLAIARESLANAKKMCEQHGHANPALVRILIEHLLSDMCCIIFSNGPKTVCAFTSLCNTRYGEKIDFDIDAVQIVCENPTPLLAAIREIDAIERTYSGEMAILPSFRKEVSVQLVFGKELDVNFWDDKRLLIAARMQLLLSHMNMIVDDVEREVVK